MTPSVLRLLPSRRRFAVAVPMLLGVLASLVLFAPRAARAQSWLPGNWAYRRAVTVSQSGTSALTSFQVQVTLPSNFAFAHAKADGSDLRITASDGVTLLPFHLDRWNAATATAKLWVRVPTIPVAGTTLYVYYGNATASSASDGTATFNFYDGFDDNIGLGYYPLGSSQTIMTQTQAWETESPHTMSMVPAPSGATYPYYGYYGLENCGGIGMAGSTDLVHWTKFASNPLFSGGGERWPTVIKDGSTYHMVHDVNYCSWPSLVWRTSTNGLTWSAPTTLVQSQIGLHNQNANLWHDPNDGKYYLYWYQGDDATVWRIMARSATTIAGLASAANVQLISSPTTIAAPNMMYRDGTYFLVTEILVDGLWAVAVYGGPTPLGPFTLLPGNPILPDDCACMFQHPVGSTVYEYYCKRTGTVWSLAMVQANLAAGRVASAVLDTTRWTPNGGLWTLTNTDQPDGHTGFVVDGSSSVYNIMPSSYSGSNYVFEGYGRLLDGIVFGLGVRMSALDHGYSINLYTQPEDEYHLSLYEWNGPGVATLLWKGVTDTIDPNTWYKLGVKVGPQGFQLWLNDSLRTPGWVGGAPDIASGPAVLYLEDGSHAQFEDVRVRAFAATDPVAAVGSEASSRPVAAIGAPLSGAAVWPAQAVALTSASSSPGTPPESLSYRWDVRRLTQRGDSTVIATATTRDASFNPPAGDDSTRLSFRIVHRISVAHGQSDSTSVVVWPEVDLVPGSLAVTPSSPTIGDSLAFTFVLRNLGRALAPRTHWSMIDETGQLLGTGITAVAALDSVPLSVVTAPYASGLHRVRVVADTLAELHETSESNNAALLSFSPSGMAGVGDQPGAGLRGGVALSRPFPNPSRGQGATVELSLPGPGRADLAVYDVSGRLVRRLLSGEQPAGTRRIAWDGRSDAGGALPTGLYLLRLETAGAPITRRLMLLR